MKLCFELVEILRILKSSVVCLKKWNVLRCFDCRQFGQFDYGQVYNAPSQADAQYYPSTVGYSGSILTPDISMSYTQQSGDNFDDEPPLLEGELHCFVMLFCSSSTLSEFLWYISYLPVYSFFVIIWNMDFMWLFICVH